MYKLRVVIFSYNVLERKKTTRTQNGVLKKKKKIIKTYFVTTLHAYALSVCVCVCIIVSHKYTSVRRAHD